VFDGLSYNRAATSSAVTVANISPTPSLAALAPAIVAAGSNGFSLVVTGSGFVSGATATVGGQPRAVTVSSPTQLAIAVLAADVIAQGNVAVQVSNPATCVAGFCASNSLNLGVTAPPPPPTLSSVSPGTVAAGSAAFTLSAAGSSFVPTSVIQVNSVSRPTSFVSATQLTATIPANDVATAGTLSVTVVTPAPGGGTSAAQILTVASPSIALSATIAPPGTQLTAILSNSPGTPNDWLALVPVGAANPSYVAWTFVARLPGTSSKTWTVPLPSTFGQYEVRFFQGLTYNRTATSSAVTVANISPTPSLAAVVPASVAAGSTGFVLAVTGSGFVNGATATVGGQPRAVTFVSATQLTIAVLATDAAAQGTAAVQVSNPAACVGGLCASNTLPLTVTAPPPAPSLTGVSPNVVARGGADFALTVTGKNFTPTSVVQLNGASRSTTFVSGGQLVATIPASDITSAGVLGITVVTPAPGGGTSSAQSLTVAAPSITVSTTSGAPGTAITVILSNPPATPNSWMALAAVGAPNPSYFAWTFIGLRPGTTTKTWTVTLPAAPGQYQVRFFEGLTYNRTATSPTIAVGN